MPLITKNNEILIEIESDLSPEKLLLIVDTGSQISLLKAERVLRTKISIKNKIEITGIVEGISISTLGMSNAKIKSNNLTISHEFQVIHGEAYLKYDGILGAEFLLKYNANIDCGNKRLTLQLPQSDYRATNVKSVNLTQIKSMDTENSEYFEAIKDYLKFEQNSIFMIGVKANTKINNPYFYDGLEDEFFDNKKFKRVELNKIELDVEFKTPDDSHKCLRQVNQIDDITSENEPIIDPCLRQKIIMEKLDLGNLNDKQIEMVAELCLKFSEAFFIENDRLRPTNVYKHSIKLRPNVDSINVKQYRVPFAQREELKKHVENWEKQGIIRKSTSRFNSPLLLVKKHPDRFGNKQFRAVLDYREVNKASIPQYYPLPVPEQLFDMLHGSTIYSCLDVHQAYHQIELEESCRFITAFSALNHHYEFCMIPFGLQSSGIAWLYTIHRVLQEFMDKNVFCYVDDVILWENSEEAHLRQIKLVLSQLIKNNIKLKPEKCKFLQPYVYYLGYKISGVGLEIDERKTLCIRKYPVPRNVKELQRFIGFVNFYRRYIPKFSDICRVLYKLCKKDIPYVWSEGAQLAFDTLREKLLNPPVLVYPCFSLPFLVISDASDYSAGCVLANRDGRDERPIQYFSKTFNDAQCKYSTVHKEILAAAWGINWFRPFLIGRQFYLVIDQKSIIYLMSGKYKDSRVHRWAIELMEYDFEVIYREGKTNVCADALSRIRINNFEIDDKKLETKVICLVQTRAKTREITEN